MHVVTVPITHHILHLILLVQSTYFLYIICVYRYDLLNPKHQPTCKTKLLDDDSTVDASAVYLQSELPHRMLVRDLRSELGSEDHASKFCLDERQQTAIDCALSQPLSLIQVGTARKEQCN